ncbi:MAG: hypothetical protein R3F61_24475 [Myxococcota bacterium]
MRLDSSSPLQEGAWVLMARHGVPICVEQTSADYGAIVFRIGATAQESVAHMVAAVNEGSSVIQYEASEANGRIWIRPTEPFFDTSPLDLPVSLPAGPIAFWDLAKTMQEQTHVPTDLVLSQRMWPSEPFEGSTKTLLDAELCTGCFALVTHWPYKVSDPVARALPRRMVIKVEHVQEIEDEARSSYRRTAMASGAEWPFEEPDPGPQPERETVDDRMELLFRRAMERHPVDEASALAAAEAVLTPAETNAVNELLPFDWPREQIVDSIAFRIRLRLGLVEL